MRQLLFMAQLQQSLATGLYGFANGEAAEGQAGADAAAGFGSGEGAGHFAAVVEAAGVQEGVEIFHSGFSSAGLRGADARCAQSGLLPCEQRDGGNPDVWRRRRDGGGFGDDGLSHPLLPDGGPVIAAGQSADNSVARKLAARNPAGSRPCPDSSIPLITEPVAGFLVSIDGGDAEFAVQFDEDVGQSTDFQDEAIAKLLQSAVETGEGLVEKLEVNGVKIRGLQLLWFVDEQTQTGSAGSSSGQRSVVGCA